MEEVIYRLLGALLTARRGLVAAVAGSTTVLWLLQVNQVARQPDPAGLAGLVGVPALLGLAAWWLFQLPPGVVFRRQGPVETEPEQRTARCLASGYFQGARRVEWRLLARSSLTIGTDGSLLVVSPPPLLAGAETTRQAFPSRGRPPAGQPAREPPRYAEWVYQPEALAGGGPQRLYQSADDYAGSVGSLMIPRTALVDAAPGWQYAGLGRWPALRIQFRGADGLLESAYLAFVDCGQRAWALGRLTARLA